MSRIDLLKPLLYEYRGCFDVHIVHQPEPRSPTYSASDFGGYYLNLETLELEIAEKQQCFTTNLENLLLQIDLYLNKKGLGDLYK